MKTEKRKFGDFGEEVARNYLTTKGYKIIDNNYQKPWGEIDLIGKKKGLLYFFEVKTRDALNMKHYLAEYSVNRLKMKKLQKICNTYLLEKQYPTDQEWQIDVISIYYDKIKEKTLIKHFENAVWEKNY